MPNFRNFQSNALSGKYTISRIIADKKDDLLVMEVPALFEERLLEENIEVHLYSIADNSLIFSYIVKNENQAIYVETLQYEDGSQRNLLFIDFAKTLAAVEIPSGRYSVTLNFFANEIGKYDNRILKVNRISTSRTEVELKLTDTDSLGILDEFAIPRINTRYITAALAQIFNQSGSDDLRLPMSSAKIDSSSIYQNFSSGSGEKLLLYNFDEDDGEFVGINTVAQNVLDIAYPIAVQRVEDVIKVSGSTSFTETELSAYVIDAIDEAYDSALQDEETNPQKYRFDLI
jgi:hypothetical protein